MPESHREDIMDIDPETKEQRRERVLKAAREGIARHRRWLDQLAVYDRQGNDSYPYEYAYLLQLVPPRIIHSEDDYLPVMAMIDHLLSQQERTPAEDDYLLLLSLLVEEYEEGIGIMDTPSPGD